MFKAQSEASMAVEFMRAVRLYQSRYPVLKKLFHVPNGGKRSPKVAMQLKAEGVRRGVCDYLLIQRRFFRRAHYNGLGIELKAGKGRLTQEQIDFAIETAKEGWYVVDCWSADTAWEVLAEYLGLEVLSLAEIKQSGWVLPHD